MKIALIGYGKMGRMIESVSLERGHDVVCIIDKQSYSAEQMSDAGSRLYTPEEGFKSAAFHSADVAIEFSRPDAARANVLEAVKQGVAVVSGTTGWDVEGLKAELMAENNCPGVMWSSNYSIGVNVLFAVNTYLARLLHTVGGERYAPSITEIHHVHKLDAPSGTAKTLAEEIMAVGSEQPKGKESREFADTNNVVANNEEKPYCPIHSIREGEVPGIHEVRWESGEDILSIRHEAKSRRGFALGAVIAAEWLQGKRGWHALEEAMRIDN